MTILDALRGIKGTLNEVEVKKEENLDKVLACIKLVGKLIETIENQSKEEANKDAHPDSE